MSRHRLADRDGVRAILDTLAAEAELAERRHAQAFSNALATHGHPATNIAEARADAVRLAIVEMQIRAGLAVETSPDDGRHPTTDVVAATLAEHLAELRAALARADERDAPRAPILAAVAWHAEQAVLSALASAGFTDGEIAQHLGER